MRGINSHRIGETHKTNKCGDIKIIEYFNSLNCTIIFNDGTTLKNRQYVDVIKGRIKNPFQPSLYGVGYLGEGNYSAKIHFNIHTIWMSMLQRCYDKKRQETFPTYKNTTVCEEWHNFQNFAKWYEENWKYYMQDWQLDKDILVKGNKIYSPKTCCFVPCKINNLFIKCKSSRGNLPIGVSKEGNKYIAKLGKIDGIQKSSRHLNPEKAFQAYKIAKENYIKELANKYRGQVTEECYQALINYKVEMTD